MELENIANILSNIQGFADKVTYYAWPEKEAPPLPYICYVERDSDNFIADGIVYSPANQIDIELYSLLKDPASELAIESALTDAGLIYEKTCDFITSENCYLTTYEIEV